MSGDRTGDVPVDDVWRVGRSTGRTIWFGEHVLHGMVDMPAIATRICEAMNEVGPLKARVAELEAQSRVRCSHCGRPRCDGQLCEQYSVVVANANNLQDRVLELESAIQRGLDMLLGKGVTLPIDVYAKLLDLALQEIRAAYARTTTDSGGGSL